MLVIACPWCGPRDESEFTYAGEGLRVRPAEPEKLSDKQWADYVFMRANTKGVFDERWLHAAGCRRYFNVIRNTANDRILASYPPGAPRPQITAEAPRTPAGEPPIGSGNDGAKVMKDGL